MSSYIEPIRLERWSPEKQEQHRRKQAECGHSWTMEEGSSGCEYHYCVRCGLMYDDRELLDSVYHDDCG